jgi:hypothetical protein
VSLDLAAVAAAVYPLDDVAARGQVSADAVSAVLADFSGWRRWRGRTPGSERCTAARAWLARKPQLHIFAKRHLFLEKYC